LEKAQKIGQAAERAVCHKSFDRNRLCRNVSQSHREEEKAPAFKMQFPCF
jgi:hypothetical protein